MTDQAEIEALRAHNAELLADLRKAKAKAKELGEQLESLTLERDEARATVQAVKLDSPVSNMAERVSLAPELFLTQWAKEYAFVLDGDAIVIRDKEGKPATLKDEKGKQRDATFTEADIRALCEASPHKAAFDAVVIASRATGGGSSGAGQPTRPAAPTQPQQPAQAAHGYGLR